MPLGIGLQVCNMSLESLDTCTLRFQIWGSSLTVFVRKISYAMKPPGKWRCMLFHVAVHPLFWRWYQGACRLTHSYSPSSAHHFLKTWKTRPRTRTTSVEAGGCRLSSHHSIERTWKHFATQQRPPTASPNTKQCKARLGSPEVETLAGAPCASMHSSGGHS